MSRTIWRLTKAKYAHDALSGHGSRLRAGRWHSKGIPMVYLAENPALALLEILVHVEEVEELLLFDFAAIPIRIGKTHLKQMRREELPTDWNAWPHPASTQRLGTRWFEEEASVVLEVPSAVVPKQKNYLLNPQHPRFGEVEVGPAEPFPIDPRLTR